MDAITPQIQLQIDKSLQVYQLLACNPRMTQEQACKNVGIDPKTYRKWIATQDEAIKVFEQTRIENERNEYAEYLAAKSAISNGLIQDARKLGVSLSERIEEFQYIEKKARFCNNKVWIKIFFSLPPFFLEKNCLLIRLINDYGNTHVKRIYYLILTKKCFVRLACYKM